MIVYLWMMIQVLGESLPISSSGHVVLLQKILHYVDAPGANSGVMLQELWAFDYLLQGVSAIIFLLYFFTSWWQLVVDRPVKIASLCDRAVWQHNILPVFMFGFLADGMTFLLWSLQITNFVGVPLACGFMITAGALWSLQYTHEKKDLIRWSWKHAMLVGLVQGCALLPGISRFATTITALQWFGYSGRLAFSISFLLQWPLIVVGSIVGLRCLHDQAVLQVVWSFPFMIAIMTTGCLAYTILYGVGKIIDKKLLWKFSYYMIIPSIVALLV